MAIDLDGFKSVNDLEGHQRGDQVLSVFARVLDSEVGQAAHVYRTGGDEFAVLAPFHPADGWLEEAVDTAVLAARSVTVVRVGASTGQALAPTEGAAAAQLMQLADERLYLVKRSRAVGR